MATAIQCEIVTPEKLFYSQEANFVVLPGSAGEMGVYYMHAPVVTTLGSGLVKITDEEENTVKIAVSGGYAEVDGQKVIVLADRAAQVSDVDANEVQAKVEALEQEISELPEDDVTLSFKKDELKWNQLLSECVGNGE